MGEATASARQWQRVDYPMPVQLKVQVGDASEGHTVLAQAVNVSERGIQVSTADSGVQMLPVGESVTCNMLIEGRPAALPGRVRWNKPTLPGIGTPGAGIEFERLSPDESGLLRTVVSHASDTAHSHAAQPVELYFAELSEPVHARAVTSDAGLHIAAALPVLKLDSEVQFKFGGAGPRFLGRVSSVTVREHDRTPCLDVELNIEAREMPRFRRYTMYGEGHDLRGAGADTSADTSAPDAEISTIRTIATAAAPVRESSDHADAAVQPVAASARVPVAHHALWLGIGSVIGALGMQFSLAWHDGAHLPQNVASVVDAAQHHTASGDAPRARLAQAPSPARAPDVFAATATATPASVAEAVKDAPAATAEQPPQVVTSNVTAPRSAAPTPDNTSQPANNAPVVSVNGNTTEVTIPLDTALTDMRSLVWASPAAVVVTLAHGGIALTDRRYNVRTGGITKLAVVPAGTGQQVRIFVDIPVLRHAVRATPGGMIVRIDHAAVRAPQLKPRG